MLLLFLPPLTLIPWIYVSFQLQLMPAASSNLSCGGMLLPAHSGPSLFTIHTPDPVYSCLLSTESKFSPSPQPLDL